MKNDEKKIREALDDMKKQRAGRGAEEPEFIFPDEKQGPLYGKIPQDLLRDPKIEAGPKALWADVHSYAREKNLKGIPTAFVSQEKLARDFGKTSRTIRNWLEELKENGWAKIKRCGQGKSNLISLYSIKRAKNG